MNKIKKIFYIAEIHLPSSRAYTVHVLKMIDNLSYFSQITELLIFNKNKNLSFSILKKIFYYGQKKKLLLILLTNQISTIF